jgi:hypothetical protein
MHLTLLPSGFMEEDLQNVLSAMQNSMWGGKCHTNFLRRSLSIHFTEMMLEAAEDG